MTDLQINIALAQAIGWGSLNDLKSDVEVFCWNGQYWRQFDYRDPVIFVSICKRWKLRVNHSYHWVSDDGIYNKQVSEADSVEKAAALCVIYAVKRSSK